MILVSGIGPERAARAARTLLDGGCRALLAWGMAGGLDTTLSAGALLVPRAVLGEATVSFAVEPALHDALYKALACCGPVTEPIVSTAMAVRTRAAKTELAARSGAVAVDMETVAVAAAAARAGVPFAVVRAVVDTADLELPQVALRALSPEGRLQFAACAAALVRDPGALASLWLLARYQRRALRNLRRAALLLAQSGWLHASTSTGALLNSVS
jgi:adenosylhomocysteine nucleosidase